MDKEKKPTRINSVIEEKKSSPFIEGKIIQKLTQKIASPIYPLSKN